jgi:class 3 adenylate cyclase/tetratricopeptide (TPR) repeat protein
VTVLFADVKGSMDLAEGMDAEEWHRIMDGFFAILTEGIHRCEGTINQFTGDGIMALFGAPLAHEDHAQRACYAALHLTEKLRSYAQDLRREKGLDFAVRMGLNSGEVVVGKIGDDLRMDYTAQGHTVGLAARMQEIAEAGKVYLTQETASRVQGFFELEDLGEFHLRGVSEPVRTFALKGPGPMRTRFDLARARGLSKFVGRDYEMQDLKAALERAVGGQGQVIGVVAEVGVGKSRLCSEFLELCRARAVRVAEGHSLPHGKMIPFLPILELLRSYFGITEQDSAEEARSKIAGTLVLADRSLEAALPLMLEFMGVPDPDRRALHIEPEVRQRQLFGALRQMLQVRSERAPSVLLIEDLHWIDGGSEAFLEPIVEAAIQGWILVLMTFRPEYHAHWMQKSYYHQLPLLPLSTKALLELAKDLLGNHPSTQGLPALIRERTSGNPFFIEEVILSLVESGSLEGERGAYRLVGPIEEIQIPERVQSVLAARIDRLPAHQKTVLDAAAVVGKIFSERLLSRLVDLSDSDLIGALRGLVEGEFIHERTLFPEAEFSFKHPLTQEVAYSAQLADRRARAHAAVAQAIEELHRDGVEAQAGLVAHHWERAGDPWRAAQWQDRAAQRAVLTHPGEATRHWLKVRSLLELVPESPETAALRVSSCTQILNLGWHLGLSADEVSEIFAEGKTLAERTGDPRSLAALYRAYALSTLIAGSVDESAKWFDEAARLAHHADDEGMKVALQTSQILLHVWAGELSRALTKVEGLMTQAADDIWLGAEILGYSAYIWAAFMKGFVLVRTGRLSEGAAAFDQALQLAQRHGDTFVLGHTHHGQATLEWFRGDLESTRARAREAIAMFESLGTTNQTAYGYLRLGAAQSLGYEWKESVENLERALSIAREQRLLVSETEILSHLAQAYLGLGQERRALETAEEAIRTARHRGTKLHECDALLALARILLRSEGSSARERIETVLGELTKLVAETGARVHEPFIRVEYAELARLVGDKATRHRELGEAHRLFVEMGAGGHAERVAGQL